MSLQISKQQVDSYKCGQLPPSCQLKVEWNKDEKPVKLKYKVDLVGAKEDCNFFYIDRTPMIAGIKSILLTL